MTTELTWSWVRWQPESALSQWFKNRCGAGGKCVRRLGIVAVARKLLIALWRFLKTGEVCEGRVQKEKWDQELGSARVRLPQITRVL